MNFFTADQHFGHENIVRYCGRPFKSAHRMDRTIIDRYNSVVGVEDTCYILGDFTMSSNPDQVESLVRKLNGRKILVLGNHDRLRPFAYTELGFESVHTSLDIVVSGERAICIHDPAPACATEIKLRWLVGHVHGLFKHLNNCAVTNVGVDVWDFTPVSEEQLASAWLPETTAQPITI